MSLPLVDAAALAVLLVFLPVLSVVQVRMLRRIEVERMGAYVSSALSLLALGGGVWIVGSRTGGASALGLVPLPWPAFAGWTAEIGRAHV